MIVDLIVMPAQLFCADDIFFAMRLNFFHHRIESGHYLIELFVQLLVQTVDPPVPCDKAFVNLLLLSCKSSVCLAW